MHVNADTITLGTQRADPLVAIDEAHLWQV